MLNVAWRAGFAPQPIALIRGPPAILVTRFAPGEAWSAADLRDPARLERLAELLRRLHEARLPGPELDLGEACARYAARARTPGEQGAGKPRHASSCAQCEEEGGSRCLCHNDPLPANVVGLRQTAAHRLGIRRSRRPAFRRCGGAAAPPAAAARGCNFYSRLFRRRRTRPVGAPGRLPGGLRPGAEAVDGRSAMGSRPLSYVTHRLRRRFALDSVAKKKNQERRTPGVAKRLIVTAVDNARSGGRRKCSMNANAGFKSAATRLIAPVFGILMLAASPGKAVIDLVHPRSVQRLP